MAEDEDPTLIQLISPRTRPRRNSFSGFIQRRLGGSSKRHARRVSEEHAVRLPILAPEDREDAADRAADGKPKKKEKGKKHKKKKTPRLVVSPGEQPVPPAAGTARAQRPALRRVSARRAVTPEAAVRQELDRVHHSMRHNLDRAWERGESLDELEEIANSLALEGSKMRQGATTITRTLHQKRCRLFLAIGLVTAFLVLGITLVVYVTLCGWTLAVGACISPPTPLPPPPTPLPPPPTNGTLAPHPHLT